MLQTFLFFMLVHAENLLSPQLQHALQQGKPSVDVIVYFDSTWDSSSAKNIIERNQRVQFVFQTLVQRVQSAQKTMQAYLLQKKKSYRSFYIENALLVKGADPHMVEELSKWSGVRGVGLNTPIKMKELAPRERSLFKKIAGHLPLIQVDKVWSQLQAKGAGIVIAGQDSGVYWQHNALKRKYRGFQSGVASHDYHWHDAIHGSKTGPCTADEVEPCDDKDHGTHTMGTMVGDDGKGRQIGVAPDAQWMACRNMKVGVGTVASYLECFEFFLAPYPRGGDPQKDGRPDMAPHIVNNSWSCPSSEGCRGDEFWGVVQAYKAAGILLVVAASNDGPNCGTVFDAPAKYSGEVISVGAFSTYINEIAYFSSLGPASWKGQLAPNLVAVADVVSSIGKGVDSYEDKMGTSMAAPQVAGVAALLWSYRPELIGQIDATLDILQKSARPIAANTSCPGFPGKKIPNAVYGYGMLDAYKALTTP